MEPPPKHFISFSRNYMGRQIKTAKCTSKEFTRSSKILKVVNEKKSLGASVLDITITYVKSQTALPWSLSSVTVRTMGVPLSMYSLALRTAEPVLAIAFLAISYNKEFINICI